LGHGIGKKYIIPMTSAIKSQIVHKAENRTMNTIGEDKYIHSLKYTQQRLPTQQVYIKTNIISILLNLNVKVKI